MWGSGGVCGGFVKGGKEMFVWWKRVSWPCMIKQGACTYNILCVNMQSTSHETPDHPRRQLKVGWVGGTGPQCAEQEMDKDPP